MKKFAFVAVVFSMFAGVVGCGGSSACDDYAKKAKDCCAKITDATAKSTCESQVDSAVSIYKLTSDADSACSAAAAAYQCTVQ